jgi:tRNA threonylcarbamoyladenosine biosynthesis protein TsaE
MHLLDRLRAGLTTASAGETRAIAAELAPALPPDLTLALHGDLGVGKTTFVQGLAHGLGIAGPVTSPTFNLCRFYHGAGRDARNLGHLDAYRLDSPAQVEALLLEDFLQSPYCLAIEWPEKISGWLPPGTWHLELAIGADQRHTIRWR